METRIALGSGKVYVKELPDTLNTSDPETLITTYCKSENEFAAVKNGATVTYTPTAYTATDDLGRYSKTVNQDETVTLGMGVITVGPKVLDVLVDTARTSSTATADVIKIGGTANAKNKTYLVIFEHIDAADGNIYVIITGTNTAELQISFQPGQETILNPVFTAKGADDEGTKLFIIMKKPGAAGGE